MKPKILFIFSRFHANPKNIHYNCGTGVAQRQILMVLQDLGFDVYFGGQEDWSYPKEYITESKAIIYIAPALPKILKYQPKGKLILFANNSHVLVRNARMKQTAEKHNLPVESLGPEQFFLPAYERSDYIMVAGNTAVNNTFLENGVPASKIIYWHNSVDTSVYKPAKEKFKEFTFVHWSSELGLRKGLPALLEAWTKWNNPAARLILMGIVTPAGRKLMFKNNFFGWAKKNLPQNVTLYGSKHGFPAQDPFVMNILSRSHIGVFPSLEDNQPASLMEMTASGLPMILTQESGFKLDPSWSYEVKPDNVNSLVTAFDVVYRDNNRAEKGINAREFMELNHSWVDFRKSFGEFLTRVLN